MRVSLCLYACLVAFCILSSCCAEPLMRAEILSSRVRRTPEGEVNVDVDKQPHEKPRVVVQGQSNVWKDGDRRVDVRGSADNRGSRGAGVSFKW